MVWRYGEQLSLDKTMGINLLDGFRENTFCGPTATDDEHPRHCNSSGDTVKPS